MKRHIYPEQFAAWIWFGNDEPPLQRLLGLAENKAAEIDLAPNGEPFPKVRDDLPGGFNEGSYRVWIESVADDKDRELLRHLITTMRISLSLESPSEYESDSDIEFIDPAGSGLKGNVFRAKQISLKRIVAVKIIKPEWGGDALRHAQAMARISGHDNVVVIHMLTRLRSPVDDRLCNAMVMEWLDGTRLGDLPTTANLEIEHAKRICTGIVSGIKHIHKAGIAHSDLHPGNVMILDDFTPRIIDVDEDRQPSFGQLSSASIDSAKEADVQNCIANILKVCLRSKLPAEAIMESDLRQAGNLDEIEASVQQIFSTDNSEKPSEAEPGPSIRIDTQLIREQFEQRIRDNDFWGLTKQHGAIVAGIIPLTATKLPFEKISDVHLPTFSRNGWNQSRRARSVASISGADGETFAVTEFLESGAIIAADTSVLNPKYHQDEHLIIPNSATCSKIIASLTSYLEILLNLEIPPPFDVFASLIDVIGYRLLVSNTTWSEVESPTKDICPPSVRLDSTSQLNRHQMAEQLRPIFDFIWREFGFQDCDKYTDSDFYNGREIYY
jgi:serine/threonine protein kinase